MYNICTAIDHSCIAIFCYVDDRGKQLQTRSMAKLLSGIGGDGHRGGAALDRGIAQSGDQ